ncbi:MAG: organic hydroperoxide resistance protein [Ferruginibacter sp.]|nr:organic hydroperoxide resistance protein [Cytophagales bacterium]
MQTQENEATTKHLYVATVTTKGGRNGHAQSSDNLLSVDLAFPKEIGGSGQATNPEQLFAAGFAACFGQTLGTLASQRKLSIDQGTIAVTANVHLLLKEVGYWLAADLAVSLPGIDPATAESLVEEAKQWCPYSNSTRGNVETTYRVI